MGNESPNNNNENDNSNPNKNINLTDKYKKDNKKDINRSAINKTNNNDDYVKNNDINNLIHDFYNFRDSCNKFADKIIQEINIIRENQNILKEELNIIKQMLENNSSNKEINKINLSNMNSKNEKENINETEKSIKNINNIDISKEYIQKIKINEDLERKKNIEKIKANLKSNNKYKFNYLMINNELEDDLKRILKDSIIKQECKLNPNFVFERQEIQIENQNIYTKIKKHLSSFIRTEHNYMLKKAQFLKNVGYLVRLSHEISNFMIKILLNIFKEKIGFHSINNETIRLYFASWIKKIFNMKCFIKIENNLYIKAQVDFMNFEENILLKEIFPILIRLYFLCYLTDIKVEVIYAEEDAKFDLENMTDDIFSDSEIEKKVLFTFLPGLYCNKQYFQNALIHTVTYKIDEPNKFQFQRPIFTNIDSSFNLDLELKVYLYYEKTKVKKELSVKFEIVTIPEIIWDTPTYEIILLDCQNYTYPLTDNILTLDGFYSQNYGRCICKAKVNNQEFLSEIILLDLNKDTNKK